MSLPNPGMDAVPFTPLTAEFLDDMIENIESLSDIVDGVSPVGPDGWSLLSVVDPTVTYNGNRSYTLTYAATNLTSLVGRGSRIRTTRTVAAPNQSASLNGTTQSFSKSSPAGMTFTDDFAVGAWIYLTSYSIQAVMSRYNGTSGWELRIGGLGVADGRVQLTGYNAGSANFSTIVSAQSIPLNRWVHISAQLDMSTFTNTTTTSYIMIDGLNVPATVSRGGTNPTALVQAGNFEIGTSNGASFFSGKIAQAWVSSAKVTQANVRAIISQGLTTANTATYSLASAYSLSNSVTDLNTTSANNLTANGSATTTNADSPFGTQADKTISTTLDYGIVQTGSFSTDSTFVVQVPEGCTIPTSGGISATSYSTSKAPYGFPTQKVKWSLDAVFTTLSANIGATNTWGNTLNWSVTIPIGDWTIGYQGLIQQSNSTSGIYAGFTSLSTSTSTNTEADLATGFVGRAASTSGEQATVKAEKFISQTVATPWYVITRSNSGGGTITVGFVTPDSTTSPCYTFKIQNDLL